jgi:aldehyde dehydrogenase (NAD+)
MVGLAHQISGNAREMVGRAHPTSAMKDIIEKQREFFASGKTQSLAFRTEMLKTLRQAIKASEAEIFAALEQDLNKSRVDAYSSEIGSCLAEISYMLKHLKQWMKPQRVRSAWLLPLSRARIVSEPLGLSLILSPWNYPFRLAIAPVIASIAAGNCVILKPSELSSHTERVLAQMIAKHFPEEYLRVVCGAADFTQALLRQKFDHIFYTGGPRVGQLVMKAAATHTTPVTLELGGKSPCIVDKDCDISRAAKRIAWGKFLNAGQTCVAPDYLLVHQTVKAKLIEEVQSWITAFYGACPQDSPDYARIINEQHFNRVTGLLSEGRVIYGAETDREALYISPTLMDHVPAEAPLMQDEIFGPVLPVLEFDDLDQAITLINQRPKPLALYIFSRDRQTQQRIIAQTSSGGVCVNDTVIHLSVPSLPFGGVGGSGFGRYNGKAGFDTFSNAKSVLYQTMLFDIPQRFPPAQASTLKILRRLLK